MNKDEQTERQKGSLIHKGNQHELQQILTPTLSISDVQTSNKYIRQDIQTTSNDLLRLKKGGWGPGQWTKKICRAKIVWSLNDLVILDLRVSGQNSESPNIKLGNLDSARGRTQMEQNYSLIVVAAHRRAHRTWTSAQGHIVTQELGIVTTRIILNLKSLTRVETNTSEEEQQHCCLDSVIVDFAALGWHFILSPPVLEFTYCRLLSSTFVVVCHCFCFAWFAFHPLPAKTSPRVHLPQVFNINICQVSQENTQKPIEAEAEQTLFSCQGKIVRKISVKHYKSLKW